MYSALLRRMIDRDVKGVLKTVNELVMEGKEPAQLDHRFHLVFKKLAIGEKF